jgi:hypothetical protein
MEPEEPEERAPIIPGPLGDDATVLLILARYFSGPIVNPEHAAYVEDYVKRKTEGSGL